MQRDIFPYPMLKIGIIGGGQLGKMMSQIAKQMGFYVAVLDPTPNCPAAHVADVQIVGGLYEADKIRALAECCDVLTFEVEHIDTTTLKSLAAEGKQIFPAPELLEIIQDKLLQKQALEQHGVPVAPCLPFDEVTAANIAKLSFPVVQKARKGGYDGKGVQILRSAADFENALPQPFYLEAFIPFEKELAVMVARDQHGKIACYPVVEMLFDDKTNICDIVAAPANISPELTEQAKQVAIHAVEALNGVGIFGVEMFLTPDGKVLVNEIAPRPHNSGHYTIEACITCQYEQLIRVVAGLPLGATTLLMPAVMLNLLGEAGYSGEPLIEGLHEALAIEGLAFHLYGKPSTKPFRKMGHITIVDKDLSQAMEKMYRIKNRLKIKAREGEGTA